MGDQSNVREVTYPVDRYHRGTPRWLYMYLMVQGAMVLLSYDTFAKKLKVPLLPLPPPKYPFYTPAFSFSRGSSAYSTLSPLSYPCTYSVPFWKRSKSLPPPPWASYSALFQALDTSCRAHSQLPLLHVALPSGLAPWPRPSGNGTSHRRLLSRHLGSHSCLESSAEQC